MRLFPKKVSKKAGLSPGTLVHVGERKSEETQISIISYDAHTLEEKELETIEEVFSYGNTSGVTWINIDGLHDMDMIEKVGNHFGLHPLALEDIVNTQHRPKLDDFEDYVLVACKMISWKEEKNELEIEHISLLLGKNYVITFQEKRGDVFNPVRERMRKAKGRIRRMGADYLAYALMDAVVDNYFIVLENMGEEIEALEERVLDNPEPAILNAIHRLKRELIFLRKSVWPLREIIAALEKGDSALVNEKTLVYFRDVSDHTIQVMDTVGTFRDMLTGMMDVYLSSVSNRMNQVMKVLTIMASIFIPLTFLAGIYGMNFEHMPELKWPLGYPLVWLIMIVLGLGMLFVFWRKKWF